MTRAAQPVHRIVSHVLSLTLSESPLPVGPYGGKGRLRAVAAASSRPVSALASNVKSSERLVASNDDGITFTSPGTRRHGRTSAADDDSRDFAAMRASCARVLRRRNFIIPRALRGFFFYNQVDISDFSAFSFYYRD